MLDFNTSEFTNASTFILLGIPGLEAVYIWVSIPFCTMYIIAISGNFTILFIVKMEPNLHEPMYYFLCMLAVINLVMFTSTVPKILSIFWFNYREINFSACFTQMYFIHCFIEMKSGILISIALDHYVAICHPLRHSTILTNPVVANIGLAVVLHSCIVILTLVLLARQRSYCRTNIIPEPFCSHIAMMKLACANISVSSYYTFFVLLCVRGLDVIFILVSYTQIIRAVFSCLPTKDTQFKTFGTCSSHLFVILAFYMQSVFIFLMQWFGQNVPLHSHILIDTLYHLVPPTMNPIFYGVSTKHIQVRLLQLFAHERV